MANRQIGRDEALNIARSEYGAVRTLALELLSCAEGDPLHAARLLWQRGWVPEVSVYEHTRSYCTVSTTFWVPEGVRVLEEIQPFDGQAQVWTEGDGCEVGYTLADRPEEAPQVAELLARQLGISGTEEWVFEVIHCLDSLTSTLGSSPRT